MIALFDQGHSPPGIPLPDQPRVFPFRQHPHRFIFLHVGSRRSIKKAGGITAAGDLVQLVPPKIRNRIHRRIGRHPVQRLPVHPDYCCQIMNAFHSALDLETLDSRRRQLRQMFQQAQIPRIQDIRPVFVFLHRKILSRALFLHQGIAPAAGLGAFSPVRLPSRHVGAHQAASGIRYAHRAVHKALQFRCNILPNLPNLRQGQFPGQNDTARALFLPEQRRLPIGRVGLRADMDWQLGNHFPCGPKHTGIRHQNCVTTDVRQSAQIVGQQGHFGVMRKYVHGHVNFARPGMGIPAGFGKLRRRKIIGECPKAKNFAAQIDGIGSIRQRNFQTFHVAGRRQQFRQFQWLSSFPDLFDRRLMLGQSPAEPMTASLAVDNEIKPIPFRRI